MFLKNMIKRSGYVILPIAIVFIGLPLRAQIKVIGRVIKDGNDPLEFANVLLLQFKDSSLVKGTTSDQNGQYKFDNIRAGKYLISISYTEYQMAYTDFFSLNKDEGTRNIGQITLKKSLADLKDVKVVAKKSLFEQKIDRMVINVSSSITYAGGTALEILERSPGVQVNQQNNSLSMNGKEGVVVMINNKISRMPVSAIIQMLAGMSANSIERIELIHTPPANLDAEGNAGYINIILKSNSDLGTNGSYAVTAGFSRGATMQGSLNFNIRRSALNLFGDLSLSRVQKQENWEQYKNIMFQGTNKENSLHVHRGILQLLYNGRLGSDFTLSEKTILGFLISAYSNQQVRKANNNGILLIDHRIDTAVNHTSKEINDWSNISANINLQHSFTKDEKINVNFNYDYYFANNPTEYKNVFYDGSRNHIRDHYIQSFKETPIKFWVAALDYSKALSSQVTMEAGLKETLSGFINKVATNNLFQNVWQKDEVLSSTHNLYENILAGYVSFSMSINEKTSLKSGLRYENTFSNLDSEKKKDIIDRKYGYLFPSFFVSHTFDERNMINFSYSRRITRPTFNNLAPTTIFVDPYTYFYGNPALQPSIGNTITGSYTYRRKIMSMSFSHESKPITNYFPKIDAATNIQSLAAENQKSQVTFSAGLNLPINITNWWTCQLNITAAHQQLNVYVKGAVTELKQQYVIANLSQIFTLPKDVSVEASGSFNSGGFFGIFKRKPYGGLNAGIQKKFPKSRSSLRLNAVNILNTMVTNIYVNMPENNLITSFKMYFTYPAYRLTYTHNFGNDKLKQIRKRTTGAEDVKQRVE